MIIFQNENCLAIIFENCPDPPDLPQRAIAQLRVFTRFSATRATILATILATIFINENCLDDYFQK